MEELLLRIDALEARFAAIEPGVRAFLPEPGRFSRLRREAGELLEGGDKRRKQAALFGLITGIKDIFHLQGFETRAGSSLPPELLAGPESAAAARLKAAGALVAGKTVTTEFAYFGPGPTRNPHNLDHTPGGSSSGSAAAVAAGLCDFALGTQTIGSINRPAAFCGVIGFKPSYDRIPRSGVIPLSPSFDHVGVFAADARIAERAAAALCRGWQPGRRGRAFRLGVPKGPYLDFLEPAGREHFETVVGKLRGAGVPCIEIAVLEGFDRVRERHRLVAAYEAAVVHQAWYEAHAERYHQKTRELIEMGRRIDRDDYRQMLEEIGMYRQEHRALMREAEIDAWITPSATGPAPAGLESTGDPVMNLPWTQAGLPTLTLPSGFDRNGLPLGTQLVGRWYRDEALFAMGAAVLEKFGG